VAALARALPGGARVLHPAGEDQAADLGAELAPSGIRVETRIVYRACPREHLDAHAASALRAGRLDAALHFSPRTARILLACVEAGDLMEPFGRLRHFCLSPAIGLVLEAAHIPVTVAVEPNEDALIAVLASGGAGEPEVAP
jgi:uroporphyrinogen-III synthase